MLHSELCTMYMHRGNICSNQYITTHRILPLLNGTMAFYWNFALFLQIENTYAIFHIHIYIHTHSLVQTILYANKMLLRLLVVLQVFYCHNNGFRTNVFFARLDQIVLVFVIYFVSVQLVQHCSISMNAACTNCIA